MNTKRAPKGAKLNALRLQLANDALLLSDKEIIEDIQAEGLDPDAVTAAMRERTTELVLRSRRKLLEHSRAKLDSRDSQSQSRISRSIVAVKRKIADLSNQPQSIAGQRVAIAFRNGKSQSDDDLLSLWQDLLELGVVSDNDLED